MCPPTFTGIVCQSVISENDLETTADLTTKKTTELTTESTIESSTTTTTTEENTTIEEKKFKASAKHICNKINPCLNEG